MGGATGDADMIAAVGPTSNGAPPPGTSTTGSAKGITRSNRCSAIRR